MGGAAVVLHGALRALALSWQTETEKNPSHSMF